MPYLALAVGPGAAPREIELPTVHRPCVRRLHDRFSRRHPYTTSYSRTPQSPHVCRAMASSAASTATTGSEACPRNEICRTTRPVAPTSNQCRTSSSGTWMRKRRVTRRTLPVP
ncbi:hypothetical protein WKI71_35635 [Streptomyces sp. MS1.AVA.1]|uniref:Uncharacterized protein n=1 Tax=Streptomyces machairae TaxID=3134109 RepID=A0ABU8US65_9ACTN